MTGTADQSSQRFGVSGFGLGGRTCWVFAVVEAGLGHAFAEAAFLDEVLLKAAALLVEEVVGLVDGAGFLRGFVPLGQPVA